MNRVVEKAANARRADSGRLGFHMEHLTDQPRVSFALIHPKR